ncbi:MAG: bifunctional DNA-formamidopyrimidine glycosylase/DNA-(apurinic or apyrimidinic site) lyase [Anaerolineales bacterium]|nr:bifunctional DNA-formamidopyrimidine glycosylase/DNA-(apurinic or apyrimidinic site) lyase [Anaerolineales bacterium]MCB8952082.1 bifunctional DNA-formamidopyrimidine glycosylase/DNA-(apurinic or apyrimidinic site) lyase [Ardenticatenales bacterium]
MPELPEVETSVRALRPLLRGRMIVGIWNDWPRHIARLDLPEFAARLRGSRITNLSRRGKYLVFHLDSPETLIIHLRMSGHLAVVAPDQPMHPHIHTVFHLDNGAELRFRDQRKFGQIYLTQNPRTVLGSLGPEPLEPAFTPEVLRERLQGRQRAIKPLLLDQSFIAGIGNIYADEALYAARIDPRRSAASLLEEEVMALYAGIRHVLQLGIDREGASIDLYVKPDGQKGDMQNAVQVFRRTGNPCNHCGQPIERIVLGGRGTHYCPRCQQ